MPIVHTSNRGRQQNRWDKIGAIIIIAYLSAGEPVALDTEISTLKSCADGDFLALALLVAWFGDVSSVTSQL